MKDSSIILSDSASLISSEDTLRTPIDQLTPENKSLAWQILDVIEKKVIKNRKEELKKALLDLAEECGEENDNGSKIYELDGAKIKKIRSKGKVDYNIERLRNLLWVKELTGSGVLKRVVTYEVDEKILLSYVKQKKLSIEEVMAACDFGEDKISLKVDKSQKVLDLIK